MTTVITLSDHWRRGSSLVRGERLHRRPDVHECTRLRDVADTDGVYEVTVEASDGNGGTVTTVAATDEDVPADTLTFAITGGADQALFTINSATGVLTFTSAPDFESATDANTDGVYEVTVEVSDGNGDTDLQAISVTVTDVNDAPLITSDGGGAVATVNAAENQTSVTTVTASDADVPPDTLTFAVAGGADQALFTINSTTGVLTFASAPDFESATDANTDGVYEVTVEVSDGNGGTDSQAISVTVTDVNDAPVITSDGGGATAAVNAAEDQTSVTTVSATDADVPADTLTFAIMGGADQALFSVNSTTGVLTFTSAPDFETATDADTDGVYEVTVEVSDGNGGADAQAISVTVTDVNDAPVITSDGGGATAVVNAAENQTSVTTVTATDADVPADTLTFAITGGADQALFSVNSTTGVLSFTSAPDFETATDADTDGVYEVTVEVSDGNSGTDSQAISVTVTDVNDAPSITSDGGGPTAAVNAAENQTAVTTVTATDEDVPVDTVTFAITGGADQALFSVNSTTGALTFTSARDFETATDANTDGVYEVTVEVSDGNGGTDSQAISVTVTDVNDAPVITSDGGGAAAAVNAAENQTSVTTVAATDEDVPADTLTFAITGGADQALFTINSATGVLTFTNAPDFETTTDANTDGVYEVTVEVSDGNGGTDSQAISVTVTDANDAPVISSDGGGAAAAVNAAENQTSVTTVTAVDADVPADTLTFAITGGVDQASFAVNASTGVLTFTSAPDFETVADANTDGVYEVTVEVSDANGGADSQAISVTVTDVNDAPVISSDGGGAVAAVNAAENQTSVTTVTATDADVPADTLTFAITGGADQAVFSVNSTTGVLTFTNAPDFETTMDANSDGVYEVTVEVSDGNGGTDSQAISVTVTDVNDAPVITSDGGGAAAAVNAAENQTSVTTVAATDEDVPADTLTFAITGGADQALFTINSATGVLAFTSAPDFESATDANTDGVYEVTVEVSDGNGGTASQAISVTVTDVNDAPAITSDGGGAAAAVNAAENQTSVTTVTATDEDVPADTLTFTITGGADQALFALNGSTGVLTFTSAPDFESAADANTDGVYEVTVEVSDGNGGTDSQAISVTVTDVNDAPVISSDGGGAAAAVNAAENQTSVTTVAAVDEDVPADTLTFAIMGGADQALFTINSATGVLTFTSAPDFEIATDANTDGVYEVSVEVSDGNGGTDSQAISVTLADVNDAPAITSDGGGATAAVNAAENQTLVTTVTATDEDVPADTLTFAITGGSDQALFSVNSATGALTFTSARDFETATDANTDGVYEVTVVVSDGNGGIDAQAISVTITGVNEEPVNSVPLPQVTLEDNALIFSAANGNQVSVSDPDVAAGPIEITLQASLGTVTLNGNAGLSFSVGDGVGDALVTFSGTLGDVNAALAILTFAPDLNVNGAATLEVTANDLGGSGSGGPLFDNDVIDITILAVNDSPINGVPGAQVVLEDSVLVFSSGGANAITVVDPDLPSGSIRVSLTATNGTLTLGGSAGLSFSTGDGVSDATMVFSASLTDVNAALDGMRFEPDANYNGSASIQLSSNDLGNTGSGGALFDSDVVSVTVDPVNDPPAISVPGSQTTNVNTPLVLSVSDGNALRVSDIDAVDVPVEVMLTAANGTVTLATTSNITFSVGDGSGDGIVVFAGLESFVNAALDGLVFDPTAAFVGIATVQVDVDDLGNVGSVETLVTTRAVSISVIGGGPLPPPDSSDPADPDPDDPGESDPEDPGNDTDSPDPGSDPDSPDPEQPVDPDGGGIPSGAPRIIDGPDAPTVTRNDDTVRPPASELPPILEPISYSEPSEDRLARLYYGGSTEPRLATYTFERKLIRGPEFTHDFGFESSLSPLFQAAIDAMGEEMVEAGNGGAFELMAGTVRFSTLFLTAGVLVWVLRAGSLLSAFLTSMPLWSQIDPLPVFALDRRKLDELRRDEEEEREQLGAIMDEEEKAVGREENS